MDTQTACTLTSEVRQQNKKCVTTKLPSQNEQQHTFHLPERNRSNSHFQFSTKLTYAPLLKTKKPFIHPSPISLCPSNNNRNEVVTLDTLEEMSFLSETEDESDNAFCLNISSNDEDTLSIEPNIKTIRTYLKNTFEILCNDNNNNKTLYKESDAILNSKKIYCKLLTCSSYHIVNETTKCKRQSFWRNSIKHIMFNPRYNDSNNSVALTSNTSHNNSLSILSILEASVN